MDQGDGVMNRPQRNYLPEVRCKFCSERAEDCQCDHKPKESEMSDNKIEIRNHPAQADDPTTGKKLVDDKGNPVPLFPDERSVWLNGRMIAYIGSPPKRALMYITPKERLGSFVTNWVENQIQAQTGHRPTEVVSVPDVSETPEDDDE